jgi:tetratricopeptide (TPR) repeat protein
MADASLGLLMILKNEAQNLERSLAPVADLFDEVVVVDTGSSDATKEICVDLGARVFDFTWWDDFALARNYSIEMAQSDWLFWLDGDNAVSRADVASLRRALPENGPAVLWGLELVESTGGRLWQKRCFANHPEARFKGRVHEQLVHPPHWPGLATSVLIRHWGYDDPQKVRQKGEYYLGLLELMLDEDPEDFYARFQAARCLINLRRFEEALAGLCRFVDQKEARRKNPQLWAHGHFLLAQCLKRLGRRGAAFRVLENFTSRTKDNALGFFHLGRLAYETGDYKKASCCLEQSLKKDLEAPVVDLDPVATLFQARFFLAKSLVQLGRSQDALSHFARALELMPQNTHARTEMAQLLSEQGKIDLAQKELEKVLAFRPRDRRARAMLREMGGAL